MTTEGEGDSSTDTFGLLGNPMLEERIARTVHDEKVTVTEFQVNDRLRLDVLVGDGIVWSEAKCA